MKVDLHMHSTCSDGTLSPLELVQRVRDSGVDCFSITDHDTIAAYRDWMHWPLDGLKLVTGVEFSTRWEGIGIHVLAYGFDLNHSEFNNLLSLQQQTRIQRVLTIAQRLAKQGYDGALDWLAAQYADHDLEAIYTGKVYLGRPHFARFLIATGAVKDMQQAFKKYLGAGKLGDVKQNWVGLAEIIEQTSAANGWSVLAHPAKYKLTQTKLRRLVEHFKKLGGHGLEVVSGQQTADKSQYLARLSVENHLLASTGSDFHEPAHRWNEIGQQSSLPTTGLDLLWQQPRWLASCLQQ